MVDYTTHPAAVLLAQETGNRMVLGQIADKWSLLILTVLCVEPCRFNEIKRRLSGITHKSLSEALQRMERNGLASRRVIETRPLGVEYSITSLGRSLQEPCLAIAAWVASHSSEVVASQQAHDKARKGLS
jgi:DNA-binding HxlR family transcriptional regulator